MTGNIQALDTTQNVPSLPTYFRMSATWNFGADHSPKTARISMESDQHRAQP